LNLQRAFLIFGSVLIVLLDRGITARLTRRALVAWDGAFASNNFLF